MFKGDDEEDKGQGEEDEGEEGDPDADIFIVTWNWTYQVDIVARLVNCTWDNVYEMNIHQFLNLVTYQMNKSEYEKRMMKKMQNDR